MKKKNSLFFIDYGSRGTSGGYAGTFIEQIPSNINDNIFYLHSEYPVNERNGKTYRRFGRLDNLNIPKFLKLPYKFFELYFDFLLIFFHALFLFMIKHQKLIILINLYQNLAAYKHLIFLLHGFCKTYLIIHDAIPHQNNYPKFLLSEHSSIANRADGIGCFGNESAKIVKKYGKDVFKFKFPCYKTFYTDMSSRHRKFSKRKNFLFIGHIRKEKGLDILLEAWRKIKNHKNIELNILGTYDQTLGYDFSNLKNVNLSFNYLREEDFELQIIRSDFVIFPYKNVTNSGVFGTANSLSIPSIVSKTPIFLESPFADKRLMFDGSVDDLVNILEYCANISPEEYQELKYEVGRKIEANKNQLKQDIIDFLNEIKN